MDCTALPGPRVTWLTPRRVHVEYEDHEGR
jgi:hypothetical protein